MSNSRKLAITGAKLTCTMFKSRKLDIPRAKVTWLNVQFTNRCMQTKQDETGTKIGMKLRKFTLKHQLRALAPQQVDLLPVIEVNTSYSYLHNFVLLFIISNHFLIWQVKEYCHRSRGYLSN